ncbi:MAG: sorbosone dehydrogenase family protein [Gammaproteobacteria bacterium]|nr:sorbosone dehydrogenase family protein [Gammaproteobacteria bacterium]
MLVLVLVLAASAAATAVAAPPIERIKLPPGFAIEIYSDAVPDARQLAVAPSGIVYAGTMQAGRVYALSGPGGAGPGREVHVIAEGLEMPTGIAYRDGALYVAEISRILRYDGIDAKLANPPRPVVVYDRLPSKRHHGWKYLGFGPDGKLYVPVGAPCNVCEVEDPFGTLGRMTPDGRDYEIVARGIRNSVGFAWHPTTHELWFTDNGRDNLGDDVPSCELDRLTKPGQHFGFPYVHQGDLPDPKFGAGHDPKDYVPPVAKLGPHVAPLGLLFYTGEQFPAAYRGALFVAEHGSWNRTHKIGYRVMVEHLDAEGRVEREEPFATGWLEGEEAWGRPVAFAQLPDGSILISDDGAGVIYRVHYTGAASGFAGR